MQQVFVGDTVKVTQLERPAPNDRTPFVEQAGRVVQKLNVAWTPDLGSLWKVRFHDGAEEVFADSELAIVDADGNLDPVDMPSLKESWGDAPRTVSMPFKRRLGANSPGATALLAVLFFALSGVLLLVAGIALSAGLLTAAGGALFLLALGAAVFLVG